jgi:biotin transport system substrate-specific component
MKHTKIRDLILCALFAALIAVGAFIRISVPPVPFTLQIFFVAMAGLILGPRRATISVLVYIVIGLVGVPVFTSGAGPAYVLTPTFGYIIGFVLQAWLTGFLIEKRGNTSFKTMAIAIFLGAAMSFAIGIPYFYLIKNVYLGIQMDLWAVIYSTFLLFVPADTVLMLLAAWIGKKIVPLLKKSALI